MECPPEIWHEVFALACTDSGVTGRSLSLVSKQFNEISRPFKYQSIAITRWRQLIAFAQTFTQLPDFQKKIKYLFIHCPYPFLDVEDNPRMASERPFLIGMKYFEKDSNSDEGASDSDSDSDSDSEYVVSESDCESGCGSLDSDEKQELLEEIQYLRAVPQGSRPIIRNIQEEESDEGWEEDWDEEPDEKSDEEQELFEEVEALPAEGNTREDESEFLDDNIQAVFDQAIHALHAILNETSSTLNILTLYFTSFKPLPIHDILPPLPFLDELHLFRCCIVETPVYDDSSVTTLFPRLRLLLMSGDRNHRSLSTSIATIAPNLTHFRFTRIKYEHDLWANGRYSMEDVIIKTSEKWSTDQIQDLVHEKVKKSELSIPIMGFIGELPESWQFLWSSRVAGLPEAWSARRRLVK